MYKKIIKELKKKTRNIKGDFFYAEPFSHIGLEINGLYKLRVEHEVKLVKKYMICLFNKYEGMWVYSIYDIKKDKTIDVNYDDYKKIIDELKKIDTDSVEHFLSYKVNK